MARLSSGNTKTRENAVLCLGEMKSVKASSAIAAMFMRDKSRRESSAQWALVKIGKASISTLLEYVNHEDERVAARALDTLDKIYQDQEGDVDWYTMIVQFRDGTEVLRKVSEDSELPSDLRKYAETCRKKSEE